MSSDTLVPSAGEFLGQIWSISTTLTEEAMAAAEKKSRELGFDSDRGIISLQETFNNLSSARVVLEDAIEQQKLIHLPITVQRKILTNLQAVSKSIQGLTAGTDEIVNLVNSVEALNTSIWEYGLHNLSDQVLGYQKKLNQIKGLENRLSKAIADLDRATVSAEKASSAVDEIEQKRAEASSALEQIKQASTLAPALLGQIKDAEAQVSALYSTIQQQEKLGGELTSNIKTASNELLSLDGSIRKFYGEVETYRDTISKTSEDAAELMRTSSADLEKLSDDITKKNDSTVESLREAESSVTDELRKKVDAYSSEAKEELTKCIELMRRSLGDIQKESAEKLEVTLAEAANSSAKLVEDSEAKIRALEEHLNERSSATIEANQERADKLIRELAKLEDSIREQIQQATGFTLFGAFQARQNQIVGSKKVWAIAIFILVVTSAAVTAWIAYEAKDYKVSDVALWVKLSLTIPLGFAIGFCTVQYSRERRLEEEYAFKSSISVSLNPYRDLIRSMLDKDGSIDQARYTQFVIDSVTNVFTPPTDKVFDSEKNLV